MTWDQWIGIIVTVIVMPVIAFVASLARRQNEIGNRLSVVETRQIHHEAVVDTIEEHQEVFRREVNEKLDMVVKHLLGSKETK